MTLLSICSALIRSCALLVPSSRREEWRREWLAEIHHEIERMGRWRRRGPRDRLGLLWRCAGAAVDAATLRLFQIEERCMIHDLRFALRMLVNAPLFTIVVILTLAIGVGANTAIFSLVNAVLLRPTAYPAGEDIVILRGTDPTRGIERGNLSLPDISDIRDQSRSLAGLAAFDEDSFNLSGPNEPLRERGAYVTHGFFEVLQIQPLLGRVFAPEEDRPGGPRVVIVNETAWQRHFGGSPDVLEAQLVIDGRPHQVVGVVADGAELPDFANIWVPLGLDPDTQSRNSHWLKAVGRLEQGASLGRAQAEMDAIAEQLGAAYPDTNQGRGIRLYGLREARSAGFDQVSVLLLGFVGFLLLLACLNVANLLLSRATERRRELAVRSAIGAPRWRIVRQLLAESSLLASAGGAAGLFIGVWSVDLMMGLAPDQLPSWMVFELDGRVILFTLATMVASVLVFGLLPALRISLPGLTAALYDREQSGVSGRPTQRLRRVLVIAQVAISLALLVGAGLMVRSFRQLSAQDPGFSTEGILTMRAELPRARYSDQPQRLAFYRRLIEEAESLPGVESAAWVSRPPLRGGTDSRLVWAEGQTREEFDKNPWVLANSISAGYLQTAGLPLLAGRDLTPRGAAGEGLEVLVNERLAQYYWPDETPLGKRVSLGDDWLVVVGVVGSIRHRALEEEGGLQLYLPLSLQTPGSATLFVRASGEPSSLAAPLRAAFSRVDPQQPVYDVLTTRQIVDEAIWDWRMVSTLLWVFAAVALVLASVGVYGLVAYQVAQRRREVGIRLALGATRPTVYGLLFRQTAVLIAIGIAVGLGLGIGVSQAMAGMLYAIGPFDVPTFAGVTLLLALVAAAAAALPARRVVKVDPLQTLRVD